MQQSLKKAAATELLARRAARKYLSDYISYVNPNYITSYFSATVCAALDQFIEDVRAGKRPILILQAPPQHGKSDIASRNLPSFIIGRFPDWNVGAASYNDKLARSMARDVRRKLASNAHKNLFPPQSDKQRYDLDTQAEFTSPGGSGGYIGVGVGGGLTGRPLDIGIIDDPTKNQEEALSETTKEAHWNWYQSVFTTRLSELSGQIIMATSWAEDDLSARICAHFKGDPRLRILRFPAINMPGEVGFDPKLPEGALVPNLKSLTFLREIKGLFSDYWWAAMYQQNPRALGGNVFKEAGLRYWLPKDLPEKFDKVVASLDATFKDTDGTDFVVIQVWGKKAAHCYLLDQVRARMSFTKTLQEVVNIKKKWPAITAFYVEDKANGPAVLDTLKPLVPGLIPIEPDGSKLARAHAVTSYWEAGNVWIPHPDLYPWVKDFISEVTGFPAASNDDQVDSMTQALRKLYPLRQKLIITQEAINRALGIGDGA
jgi:predicted phage terminase large subunit-like protein